MVRDGLGARDLLGKVTDCKRPSVQAYYTHWGRHAPDLGGLLMLVERLVSMPLQTILEHYAREALNHAAYQQLEDGSFVGRVPELKGVIAFGADRQQCEDELFSVIEDWARIGVRRGADLPMIGA